MSLWSTSTAQRVAVDAQPLGGPGLVAFGLGHHHVEHRLFHDLHDHVIDRVGFGTRRSLK